jgi:hypothetical protein
VESTTAPIDADGSAKVTVPSKGPFSPIDPPMTNPSPSERRAPSSRISTDTFASNAVLTPLKRTGDEICARAAGSWSSMLAVAAPRTHHDSPRRRTSTVVTGPDDDGRISISPD